MRKGIKAVIISAVSLVLVAAIAVGIVWAVGRNTDPVKVTRVSNFTTGYYDGGRYYDGRVTADNLQSVYLSNTQTVTEVLVTEGQTVKKGDALLRYDTTLSDIQLERQKIKVQQAKLSVEQAKKELAKINAMKPYTPPPVTVPPTEPPTEKPEPIEELPYFMGGKGTQESPYRFLWSEELTYDEAFLMQYLKDADEAYFAFEIREQNALNAELISRWGLRVTVRTTVIDPTEPTQEPADPAEPTEPTQEPTTVRTLVYSFFTPEDMPDDDNNNDKPGVDPDPWVDDSSGYTAAEIAQMRNEKQKEIRDLELTYRMEQVEAERMEAEASGGTLYSKVDGTVTRLVDADTARSEGSAFLTVSGGGCYYVNIAIGEFERETLPLGTPVTVESWMSGWTTVEGTIESISDTPVNGYYNGNGNPNVTLYNAVVAVPADAQLVEDSYVSVVMQSGGTESAMYLNNMFIRSENGRAYVYKRGEDGTLVKTYVKTGAILWGEYTAIYSGLTEDDWVAFPYGKEVKDGAKTVEADAEEFTNTASY